MPPCTRHIVGSGDRDVSGAEDRPGEAPVKITQVVIAEKQVLSVNSPGDSEEEAASPLSFYG